MRFVNKTIEINPDSFAPELHLTIALPMELAQDNQTNQDVEVAIASMGAEFMEIIKTMGNK